LLQAEAIQHQNALLDNREKVRGLLRQHSVVLGHRFKFLTELLAKLIGKRR
jgi:hypothetical protein